MAVDGGGCRAPPQEPAAAPPGLRASGPPGRLALGLPLCGRLCPRSPPPQGPAADPGDQRPLAPGGWWKSRHSPMPCQDGGALGRPVCARQSTGRSLTRSWAGVGGRGPGGVKAPGSLSPEPPADLGPAQPSPGSGRPSRPPPPPSPLRQPHAERPACSRRASGPPGGLSKATLPHRSPGHGAGGLVVKPESSWRGELRMGRRPGGLGACSPAHKMPPPPTHHVSLWLSGSVTLTQYTHTHTHTHTNAHAGARASAGGGGGGRERERERERERGREREGERGREKKLGRLTETQRRKERWREEGIRPPDPERHSGPIGSQSLTQIRERPC